MINNDTTVLNENTIGKKKKKYWYYNMMQVNLYSRKLEAKMKFQIYLVYTCIK